MHRTRQARRRSAPTPLAHDARKRNITNAPIGRFTSLAPRLLAVRGRTHEPATASCDAPEWETPPAPRTHARMGRHQARRAPHAHANRHDHITNTDVTCVGSRNARGARARIPHPCRRPPGPRVPRPATHATSEDFPHAWHSPRSPILNALIGTARRRLHIAAEKLRQLMQLLQAAVGAAAAEKLRALLRSCEVLLPVGDTQAVARHAALPAALPTASGAP